MAADKHEDTEDAKLSHSADMDVTGCRAQTPMSHQALNSPCGSLRHDRHNYCSGKYPSFEDCAVSSSLHGFASQHDPDCIVGSSSGREVNALQSFHKSADMRLFEKVLARWKSASGINYIEPEQESISHGML